MRKFSLPSSLLEVMKTIEDAGYEVWCVGGCVRDMIRNQVPDDYDLASSAPTEVISKLFPKVIPTGIKHGTVTVVCDMRHYEITRYRIDGEYSDSRRPDSVKFTSLIEEDLARRDFTINAIAYHPERGIFDPFQGEKDIDKRIIRTVGDPDKRFKEDALRILRAIRFSAKLGFEIETDTLQSIKNLANTLRFVSVERKREEIIKALSSPAPEKLEVLLNSGGLEFIGLKNCDLSDLRLLENDPLLRFSSLCLRANSDAEMCAKILKFSNAEIRKISSIERILKEKKLTIGFAKENAEHIGLKGALKVAKAYGILHKINTENLENALEKAIENNEPFLLSQLNISGFDLKALGFFGEEIGKVQRLLLKYVIENPEFNQLELLKKKAQSHKTP